MLKKLILGLLTLSVLASPTKNFSNNRVTIDPSVEPQKQNAANLRFGGLGLGEGFNGGFVGPSGPTFPGFGGGDMPRVIAGTFTVTVPFSAPFYVSDDGEVLSESRVNFNSRKFTIKVNKTVGVHKFFIQKEGSIVCVHKVFSYLYKNVAYTSEDSKEDAWYQAIKSDYESGILTRAQAENSYAEFLLLASPNSDQQEGETTSPETLPPHYAYHPNSPTANFYYHVEWQDKNGNWSPLSECLAALFIDDKPVKYAFLNEDGYAFFNIDSENKYWNKTCTIQLRVYTETRTFTLGNNFNDFSEYGNNTYELTEGYGENDYYVGGVPQYPFGNKTGFGIFEEYFMLVSSKTTVTITENTSLSIQAKSEYDEDKKTSRAMSICQALALCERFAKQNIYGYADHPNLKQYHLNIELSNSECLFEFDGGSKIHNDGCEEWIIPFKMYGLYVQGILEMLGNNDYLLIMNDSGNLMYEDNILFSKKMCAQTIWHRSIGNIFAILAYESMAEQIGHLATTQSIRDLIDLVINYEANETAGEGSIYCVTTYLYRIYTGFTAKNGKSFAQSFNNRPSDFLSIILTGAISTLNEFINWKYPTAHPYENNTHNSILEDLGIAPSEVRLVNEINDNTRPTLEWNPGGCVSKPNNNFKIWFYSGNNGEDQFEINNIDNSRYTLSDGKVRYTLTNDEKTHLVNIMGKNNNLCYVVVCGYNTNHGSNGDDNYVTGPYYSMFTRIVMPEIIQDDFLFEKEINYGSKRGKPYLSYNSGLYSYSFSTYVKFNTSCNAMFFTRGEVDSIIKIRKMNGFELASDDNSGLAGNAFVSYNVMAGETYDILVETINANDRFEGWSQLDIVQSVNSYNNDNQITHPTSLGDIKRINYNPVQDSCPFEGVFGIEVGSTSTMIFEADYGGGYNIELNYTSNINLAIIPLGSECPCTNDYFTGNNYYVIGCGSTDNVYYDHYINLIKDETYMILVSRENRYSPFSGGTFDKYFSLRFGITYLEGEW